MCVRGCKNLSLVMYLCFCLIFPDIVFFGESLPARFGKLVMEVSSPCSDDKYHLFAATPLSLAFLSGPLTTEFMIAAVLLAALQFSKIVPDRL